MPGGIPKSASTDPSLQCQIDQLGPWFHNLHLPGGVETAPNHELGDFPYNKWSHIAPHLPDVNGWHVLDIGCNAGFYAFELARRGAQVTAIDIDPHYLQQARWAAEVLQLADRIEFHQMQVYELADWPQTYDLVWFMGVFYHLRYPQLALDIVARKVDQLLVFQTMTMPGTEVLDPPEDLSLEERRWMTEPGWPKMAFIEKRVAADPTNWWAPNHACVEALLRDSGFTVMQRPTSETYLCRPQAGWEITSMREEEYQSAIGRRSSRSGS